MADFSYLARPSAEWTSFLQQQSLPPTPNLTSNPDIKAIRRRINSQRFTVSSDELKAMGGHGVKTKTSMIVGEDCVEIPIRLYVPGNHGASVLLYFHGGGFFSGSLSTEDSTCTSLALNCGVTVVSVGYRLAPEWTTPAPFQDAWDAHCWVIQNASGIGMPRKFSLYVIGIGASACLAASIVIRERMVSTTWASPSSRANAWPLPDKFPYEQVQDGKASPMQCQNAALLSYSWVVQYARMMDPPESCRDSPIINPLLFDEKVIDTLPPTYIMVCGHDPLRDHGMLFKEKLQHLG
ncbi:Abhydrolase-3 domain-containing protein [Fusarium sp. Ph1]|nr:Abhydrolase-3 domain-containing protein [Fusarium sp. Ph1]